MNDPIIKKLTVPLSAGDAFTLFTADIDSWWPKDPFSVKGAAGKVRFADHKDGQIVETDADGKEHVWGTIIAYDPGKYLAFSWHPGRGPEEATAVTVGFTQTKNGTDCELTHSGFEILGDTADAISTSYLNGWDLVLGCFKKAVVPATVA